MYEDEYYDGYYHPPQKPRRSLHWKWLTAAVLMLSLVLVRFCHRGPQRPRTQPPRTQVVKVLDWQAVDARIRLAVEDAHTTARQHAEIAVRQWIRRLRDRVDNDFLPWHFSYWNQQALALKAIGYHVAATPLAEGLAGKQPSARARLETLVENSFAARVIQPQSAQLAVEKITRESVEVYLQELSRELTGLQAEYGIPQQEWQRYLRGLAGMTLAIEGNRQVPLITKAAVAGSGMAAAKLVRIAAGHLRVLIWRMTGKQLLEDSAMLAGRRLVRGGGWLLAGIITVWDVADHHRMVQQNLPVLRRSLGGYLDELEEQVLHDPVSGVFQTLETVQRNVLAELAGKEGGG